MAASDPIKDYGAYRPTAWVKALLALSQRTVLGRGKARRWIAKRLHAAHSGPLDVVLWGQPARVHVGRNTNEVKALLNPARFNRAELDLVRQYMPRRGGVFVDVGANAGMVSLAARAGMETGTLLCIEPQPEMFRRLRFNLEARRAHGGVRVVLVQAALGPQLGRARLAVPAQPGMASLARLDTEIADHVDVDMRRLDQLCQSADLGQID
ncbi:MAG: FkbM family methyltransferase, partial [Pseudomonadota bacterium]